MMMTARWLLDNVVDPSDEDIRRRWPASFAGGTGYENIVRSIRGLPSWRRGHELAMGFGRMPRKEDARFVRGRGTYVDDVRLPGMVYGAVLRSPLAHAHIRSIDTTAAQAHPKVSR